MLGDASVRSRTGPPCARKIHDAETLCQSSLWTQVGGLRNEVAQQEREPEGVRTQGSRLDPLPSPAQWVRPPTLPIDTRAARMKHAGCGLQLDFTSLQLDDEDDAWPLPADGVGIEGLRTGQKVLALPLGDSISARPGSPLVPAKPIRNWPVADQAPPKLKVPSHALPAPSPPPTGPGGGLATWRGTVPASPGEDEPRANQGHCDMNLDMDALPRDSQGLPMWPCSEGPVRPVVESASDWSSGEDSE